MSNGRSSVIRPAAVNISPADDWQTAAIKYYDKAEGRRIQSEQSAEQKRQFDETMDFNKDKAEKSDWNLMIEQAETPAQKKMIANAGVMAGHLPAASLDVYNDAAIRDEAQKDLLKSYYAADDASKVELWPKLRDNLIETNSPRLAKLEEDFNIRKSNVENKEMIDMMTSQYGDVFSPQLKSLFESKGALTDSQLNMATKMVETSFAKRKESTKQRYDLAKSLIGMQTKGDMPSQEQINTVTKANMLGYKLLESLNAEGYDPTKDDDTQTLPYPELGLFDFEDPKQGVDRLTGTFDNLSEEEKSRQFASAMDELGITQESWGDLKDSERANKGQEIIDYKNKKDYSRVVEPAKAAGFAGVQYEDPRGSIEITDEMIDAKLPEAMKKLRVPKGQQKNPNIISQARKEAEKMVRKELQKQSKQKAIGIATETLPSLRTGPFGFGS